VFDVWQSTPGNEGEAAKLVISYILILQSDLDFEEERKRRD